jgi:hypothetical protein
LQITAAPQFDDPSANFDVSPRRGPPTAAALRLVLGLQPGVSLTSARPRESRRALTPTPGSRDDLAAVRLRAHEIPAAARLRPGLRPASAGAQCRHDTDLSGPRDLSDSDATDVARYDFTFFTHPRRQVSPLSPTYRRAAIDDASDNVRNGTFHVPKSLGNKGGGL